MSSTPRSVTTTRSAPGASEKKKPRMTSRPWGGVMGLMGLCQGGKWAEEGRNAPALGRPRHKQHIQPSCAPCTCCARSSCPWPGPPAPAGTARAAPPACGCPATAAARARAGRPARRAKGLRARKGQGGVKSRAERASRGSSLAAAGAGTGASTQNRAGRKAPHAPRARLQRVHPAQRAAVGRIRKDVAALHCHQLRRGIVIREMTELLIRQVDRRISQVNVRQRAGGRAPCGHLPSRAAFAEALGGRGMAPATGGAPRACRL